MHMADALVSPAVGGVLWAAAAGLAVHSARKVGKDPDEGKIPLMGVLGAFIFAVQMITFAIPGTGSSGHLAGGMLLAILLGPAAGFITMASVLFVQALFFADGGLLALGCNIFNLAFVPCFLVHPLVYRWIAGSGTSERRVMAGAAVSGWVALQLGAFFVVVETVASGISDLPFWSFLAMMQAIHLVIGLAEGLVSALVVRTLWKARPAILENRRDRPGLGRRTGVQPLVSLLLAAVVLGALFSLFASEAPDGLEWSIARTAKKEHLPAPRDGIHQSLADLQERTAFLPDYDYRHAGPNEEACREGDASQGDRPARERNDGTSRSQFIAGTSLSGIVGGLLTLLLVLAAGFALKFLNRRSS